MSIVLWTRLEALEPRVAALETAQAAASVVAADKSVPATAALARSNALRKGDGERLRGEIRRIVATHPAPQSLTARAVLHALSSDGRAKTPALRTVQWHLRAIRNAHGIA